MVAVFRAWYRFVLAVLLVVLGQHSAQAQFGVVFSSSGPVDRSFGGAATAAPIDATGALYWNPATITGLDGNQVDVGLEALYPHEKLSSFLPASAIAPAIPATKKTPAIPAVPPTPLAGTDRGDNGVFVLPNIALVWQPDGAPVVYGFGVYAVGGFGVNYTVDPKNPILSAQPTSASDIGTKVTGVGPLYSNLQIYEVAPTVACHLTDQLSIGIAPTLALANLSVSPALLAVPDANGVYPPATNGKLNAGGGAQAGIYFTSDWDLNFGLSVKSPQMFQTFKYQTVNSKGFPTPTQFQFDYPGIASLGISYTGLERWVLASDFRYIDYRNATGFDGIGFVQQGYLAGSLHGLGWNDVFALALGAQYEVSSCFYLRLGYTYNTDPIPNTRAAFNVASPLIIEHTIYAGLSYDFTESFRVSLAYAHAFDNSIQGPYITPRGTIPGGSIQSTTSADTWLIGATIKF
jgi:long-chain fatty acid transport protein